MFDTATHVATCSLETGDLVFLSSDRVAAKVVSVDLAGSPTSEVVLTYLEIDNMGAGYRQTVMPVVSAVLCVPGGAA